MPSKLPPIKIKVKKPEPVDPGSGFGKDFAEDLDVLLSNTRSWIDNNDFLGPIREWVDKNNDYFMNTLLVIFVIWIGVAILLYLIATFVLKSNNSEEKNQEESKSETKEVAKSESDKSEVKNVTEPLQVENQTGSTLQNDDNKIGESSDGVILQSIANEGRITPPISIGSDFEAVDWVNQCIFKICESPSIRTALTQLWLDSISQYTKSLGIEEFTYIHYESLAKLAKDDHLINFSNLVTQSHPGDNLSISMDIDLKDVSISAEFCQDSNSAYTPIIIKLLKLKGRCTVTVFSRERICNAKLEGWPEIKLSVMGNGTNSITTEIEDVAKELTISSLRGSQVNINLDDFEGNSMKTHPFPVFLRKSFLPNPLDHSTKDSTKETSNVPYPTLRRKAKRFLHVCVAKAVNLTTEVQLSGTNKSTLNLDNCYVSLELDEPCQKFRTDAVTYSNSQDSILWNQTYTFELSNKSKEILFEVWNESKDKELFLGLGIVSTDELQLSQSQRMVIPLQGNPAFKSAGSVEEDIFGGLLTLQFLLTNMDSTTKTEENMIGDNFETNIATLDTDALDLPDSEHPDIPRRSRKNKRNLVGRFKNRLSKSASAHSMGNQSAVSDAASEAHSMAQSEMMFTDTDKRKSGLDRVNEGLRQFLRELRAMSADRIRSASQNRAYRRTRSASISSRGFDYTQIAGSHENGSGISDVSAASAMSGRSNVSDKTYVTEESSLVLECREKGQIKHYLIPYHVAKKGKFGKKGTKLHIFMDHVFVAQHIKSGTPCSVCLSSIPLRLGKQGYKCRDCALICHKPCHVRVDSHCLETSMPQMELLFLPPK